MSKKRLWMPHGTPRAVVASQYDIIMTLNNVRLLRRNRS
jgi:hypothetical protein